MPGNGGGWTIRRFLLLSAETYVNCLAHNLHRQTLWFGSTSLALTRPGLAIVPLCHGTVAPLRRTQGALRKKCFESTCPLEML